MVNPDEKKSLSTRVFEAILGFVLRFRIPVLIILALLTIFFAYHMTKLSIDAGVFSFSSGVPPTTYVLTPSGAPEGGPLVYELPPELQDLELPAYGYMNRSEDEKMELVIPPDMTDGTQYSSFPDGFVVIFSSDILYTPEVLNVISDVMDQMDQIDIVGYCISPFDFVTVEKRGTRLALVPMSPVQDGEEWTEETAEIFRQRLMNDDMAKNFLYSEDVNTIMLYYRTRSYNAEQQEVLSAIIDPLRDYGRVALNGGSVITNRVTYYIFKDLALLLALCFVVILIVYYLSYRTLRAVLIPSSLSLISIVWVMGTMSLLGIDLSIVSILVPCLVLTLGSSYSVHMLSEYYANAKDPAKAVSSYALISKTIISACLTTVTGFLAMLVCHTQMFKDFGLSAAIGIAYCAILAVLYLPSTLSLLPQPKQVKVQKIQNGRIMGGFIRFVNTTVTKYWIVVLVIFVLMIAAYLFVNDKIAFNSNYMDYFPQDDVLVQDSIYFAQTMGGTDPFNVTIVAPNGEEGYFLQAENLRKVYEYEETVMAACPDIVQSLSFSQYVAFLNRVYSGETGIPDNNGLLNFLYRTLQQMKAYMGTGILDSLISEDGSTVTLAMRNYDAFEQTIQTTASARRVSEVLDHYRYLLPEGTTSRLYCGAESTVRASDMIVADQDLASAISIICIIVIATFTLTSMFRGLVSVIPVIVGIMFNYIFMYIADIPFDLVTIGFSSITVGAGIDDALHFLLHYRINRKAHPGLKVEEIVSMTMNETGRPIILTTVSIVAGMLMLILASFTPIRYFGLFMSVSLSVAMLATIFVLPVVMIVSVKIRDGICEKLRKRDRMVRPSKEK